MTTTNGSRMIFVNLPVKDLDRSVDFFTKLGFSFDPRFTDESATQLIVSDSAFVMLSSRTGSQTSPRRKSSTRRRTRK